MPPVDNWIKRVRWIDLFKVWLNPFINRIKLADSFMTHALIQVTQTRLFSCCVENCHPYIWVGWKSKFQIARRIVFGAWCGFKSSTYPPWFIWVHHVRVLCDQCICPRFISLSYFIENVIDKLSKILANITKQWRNMLKRFLLIKKKIIFNNLGV